MPDCSAICLCVFLLTRPSRGATTRSRHKESVLPYFYSHAPRGARPRLTGLGDGLRFISTHTPLAGRDDRGSECLSCHWRFLLTRPSRGATRNAIPSSIRPIFISTHTPLAGRDLQRIGALRNGFSNFYSHAPRGARLRCRLASRLRCVGFLLTRPSRGATLTTVGAEKLAETHFYSHAPRGARQLSVLTVNQ